MRSYFKKTSKGDITFDVIKIIFLGTIAFVTLFPFINIVAISLNDARDAIRGGIFLWPRVFSTESYREVFRNTAFIFSIRITVARTIAGTLLALFVQSSVAYALSRREFVGRKAISLFLIFTMYFSVGLIPVFMLINALGLTNNFLVFILPGAMNMFNVILIRSYIDSLPESLVEAARIDGANDLKIYFSIILPLAKPILMTVGLFTAIGQWNSWFDAHLYITQQHLQPMQAILVQILNTYQPGGALSNQQQLRPGQTLTPESIRMAATVVSTVPIILVYPFIQKHFIKGMLIGSVKD